MNGETILIVDDNRQIADFVARRLVPELGYRSLVAYTGRAGLEILHREQISLLLLDLNLPDMTGLDLLHKLSDDGKSVPTILVTAHGSEHVAAEALRLGAVDYLSKPVDADTLNTAINRALNESRLRRERDRLTARFQEQVSLLQVLSRLGQSLTSTLDVDEVLRRIVEAGVYLTQAEEGFLAILEKESDRLYLRAAKNIDQKRVKTMRLPVNDTLLGMVLSSGRPIRKIKGEEGSGLKVSTGYLVYSLLHVPIFFKGNIRGVLSVVNHFQRRAFTERDENVLASLADYAAAALENASLYEQAWQEIARREQVEAALRESEERYVLAVRGANDGIWDWNLRTNQIYYSPRWKSMLGYEEDEIADKPEEWFDRVYEDDLERLKLDIAAHSKGITLHFENEHRMMHKDGTYRWMLSRGIAVHNEEGVSTRLAGSLTDITDRKDAEEKLLRNAFYDGLTSLANRALFAERLRFSIQRAKRRSDYLFAVLFLDLDRFKNVNDSLGHMIGDQLLVAVAHKIESGRRTTDTVARLGGDEFAILLDDLNSVSDANEIAACVLDQLREPFILNEREVLITASIGIVVSSGGYERPEDVLRDADIAMYSAKANGKARFEIFDPVMRSRILARLELESDLRRALASDELVVYYQPIASLAEGRVTGFEALARWKHPTMGLLAPAEFIPLAEETGMIIALDRLVLRAACCHMAEWNRKYHLDHPLTVSVNLSGKQVTQPDLLEFIQQVLEETHLEPNLLRLEITENVILENDELTIDVFTHLQALGVQVQIDDFGVGYSSLNYLSRFPINALKIDRTFIRMMTEDKNQLEIVQAIVNLTHRLGVGVIAEGMETQQQMDQLLEIGCEFAQGYLISTPMDDAGVEAILGKISSGISRPLPVLKTLKVKQKVETVDSSH